MLQDFLISTVKQAPTSFTRSSSSASPFPTNQPHLSIPDNPIKPTATCLTPDMASDSIFPPPSTSETCYVRSIVEATSTGVDALAPIAWNTHFTIMTPLCKVPLTHMFKHSLSAPASQHRLSYPSGLPATANLAEWNHPLWQVTVPMDTMPTPYDGTGHLAGHHAHGPGPGCVRWETISLSVHSSNYLFTHSHRQHDFLLASDNQHLLS
jgi:hypothetical protein